VSRRISVALALALLVAGSLAAAGPAAAGSPVAVDDPAIPSCMSSDFGGSFPIPEDWGQFAFSGSCSATANDLDAGGTIVSWAIDSGPAHGTLDWLPGVPGVFGYTPDPDFSTPAGDWTSDSFTYHVVDDAAVSSNEATYRFWVTPVNDAPTLTAGPEFVDSPEDTPYSAPWATDISPGPNEASQTVHFELAQTILQTGLTFTSPPAIGSDGTLTFTPAPNSTGVVRLAFVAKDDGGLVDPAPGQQNPDPADTSAPVVVEITVTAVNDPPVAVDDEATVGEDSAGWVTTVTGNDSDADGDALSVVATTDGAKGTTSIDSRSSVRYVPTPDAFGADSYTYTVSDGHGGTDTATVDVTISPAEDPPVAADDGATISEDAGPAAIDVLANDSDVDLDPLSITAVTDGAHGTVAITGGGTGLTYAPAANASGSDTFSYTVGDGHGGTDTATVDVTISAVPDPPVAAADAVTVSEDQPSASSVDVLANDTDADGDALTVTARTNGAKGIVTITGGGTAVSYKPNANAFGADTFNYTVDDGNGGVSTATVSVTIGAVNDPPNAVNDGVPTPTKVWLKGLPKAIPVLANDTSAPDAAETLLITAVSQGSHGIVAITGGGTGLTYQATGTATGIDVFTYTLSDGHGGTDTASVQVTVARDTTAPVASITGLTKTAISGSTKLRLRLTWTLGESGSGIRSQLLQRRTGSGSWITVALASSTTRTISFTMSRGHTYVFRVRGVDRAGNVGLFASRSIRI
jgi:hypothetical protein